MALAARALGADEVWVSTKDAELEKTIESVVSRFGGDFSIRTGVKWRDAVRSWEGKSVHLTMYGQRIDDVMPSLGGTTDLLVVVGAEKVPREVYDLVDYNMSVGNQPHSEIAALAVFLDRLTRGESLYLDTGGRMKVVPNPRGKTVIGSGEAEGK